ncbi:2036_t:CDS:2 [Funneliformis caledonium]|uniref:Thioredoxin n=2 Tax=Funneliformis TaxID=1117308 RepID=A0A9N8YPK4_9GLOM|nr:7499_t:CDS:2 [Funneliformis mosseae]CAG8438176.1 2036_t:CDS:2 [Funneliformis caledonium]
MPIIVDSQEQFDKFISNGKLVIVDFWADWCGPCRMITPKFDELSKTYPEVIFLKVNTDEHEKLMHEQEIKSLPTFRFFKDGKTIKDADVIGADPRKLEKMIKDQLGLS